MSALMDEKEELKQMDRTPLYIRIDSDRYGEHLCYTLVAVYGHGWDLPLGFRFWDEKRVKKVAYGLAALLNCDALEAKDCGK